MDCSIWGTWLWNNNILSYNAYSKTRIYQIHERELESVVKNMQYLDLFSCRYVSLCEISVFPTALVALVFLRKCTAKSKAVVRKGHGHKMAGKSHRETARVKNNCLLNTAEEGKQLKQQQEKESMDQRLREANTNSAVLKTQTQFTSWHQRSIFLRKRHKPSRSYRKVWIFILRRRSSFLGWGNRLSWILAFFCVCRWH